MFEINTRMVSYRAGQGLIFIGSNNIDGTCLNRGRLRLNEKGCGKFTLNLIESMKSIWLHAMHVAQQHRNLKQYFFTKVYLWSVKTPPPWKPMKPHFSFFNINSIRYKSKDLKFFCESKLDSSFPVFYWNYNKLLRLDVSGRSGDF